MVMVWKWVALTTGTQMSTISHIRMAVCKYPSQQAVREHISREQSRVSLTFEALVNRKKKGGQTQKGGLPVNLDFFVSHLQHFFLSTFYRSRSH